jgi:hypothetical protein
MNAEECVSARIRLASAQKRGVNAGATYIMPCLAYIVAYRKARIILFIFFLPNHIYIPPDCEHFLSKM